MQSAAESAIAALHQRQTPDLPAWPRCDVSLVWSLFSAWAQQRADCTTGSTPRL